MKTFSRPRKFKIGLQTFGNGNGETLNRVAIASQIRVRDVLSPWLSQIASDNFMRIFVALWFLPVFVATIFILFNLSRLPQQVPLFYSQLWGEGQLAPRVGLFLPLGGAAALGLLNLSLGINFLTKDKVFAYILSGTAALLSLLASITIFNIVNLIK